MLSCCFTHRTRVCPAPSRAIPEGWPSNHQPIGTIIHRVYTSIRLSCRVYTSCKIFGPMEQLTIFLTRQKKWKTGKGRHAWSPQRVHFSDRFFQKFDVEQGTQRCTKVIKHCACAVKWASLRHHSFRSGQTLSPARCFTPLTWYEIEQTVGELSIMLRPVISWVV